MSSEGGCLSFKYAVLVLPVLLAGCSDDPVKPAVCPYFAPISSGAISPTWSPDGSKIAYADATDSTGNYVPGFYVVDTTGGGLTKLLGGAFAFSPELAWSPDGSRLAYVVGAQLWTLTIADRSTKHWPVPNDFARYPAWSPDGRFIVYTGIKHNFEPDTVGGLHILDTADGTQRALLHDDSLATDGVEPAWSPDGQTVAFVVNASPGSSNIFSVRIDGTQYRRLTSFPGYVGSPQWSPDSRRIFFDMNPPPCLPSLTANHRTWRVNADGTGLQQWPVTLDDARVQFGYMFRLSPNGQRTAFIGLDSTGTAGVLTVMNLDGSGRKQLSRKFQPPVL